MLGVREWIGVFAIAAGVVGANYAINIASSNGIRSELSTVRGEVAAARADIAAQGATMVALKDEFVRSRQETRADMDKYVDEMRGIVEGGLEERTDEIGRALMTAVERAWADGWRVRIANIPSGTDVAERMAAIAADYPRVRVYAFADKLNYEFDLQSLSQPEARAIAAAWATALDEIDINVYAAGPATVVPAVAK